VRLTYDDLRRLPEDGLRHELIDGEHYVTPSPNLRHQRILGKLFHLIQTWLDAHTIGEVFVAALDVVFSDIDVVEPDILYVSHERAREVMTPLNIRGVPELVVEIGSPSTRRRDETIKRRLYERAGVGEYWFVDPEIDVVRVYRHTGGGFERAVELSRDAGDVLTTSLFPGLEIPLERMFADPPGQEPERS
jgi:Uma2 family endonuclease